MPGIRRRALIDLDAFATNLSALPSGSWLDARADAYGHGFALLAPVARSFSVGGVVVSDERDAVIARAAGFSEDEVRIGRIGYGETAYGVGQGERPVMTLVGEIVAVKRVPARSGVSYGYTHRTEGPTTLALVALGYADGVPRLASNRAALLLSTGIHRIAGRIAMDQLVVDCGDEAPEVGADAILFGDAARGEPSAAEWANWTQREPLDLTAGVGDRVERIPR